MDAFDRLSRRPRATCTQPSCHSGKLCSGCAAPVSTQSFDDRLRVDILKHELALCQDHPGLRKGVCLCV
jgi:hypothetical protein